MKSWGIVHIKNGQIANPAQVRKTFLELRDGKYLYEINTYNKRSTQQNRYYFGIVVPMIQKGINDLGHDLSKEEIHDFLKAKFNYDGIANEETGEYMAFPLSTTRLNKEEFSNYIRKIQLFAADFLGVVIPDPGEQIKIYEDE